MSPLKRLFGNYQAYHGHGRPLLKYVGIVAAATYVLFYLVRFTQPDPRPFDDIALRLVVVTLFILLALRDRWPPRLRRFYLPFSYAALVFCLPFFNVFMALERHGGVPAISNCFIALTFLVLVADWRNTAVMLVAGIATAALVHFAWHPASSWPRDLLLQIPAYLVIVIGGAVFKLSDKQIDAEKARLATALAGSIAHEARNPLARVQHALEQMQRVVAPSGAGRAELALNAGQVFALQEQLADSQVAVRRGLQVISMILGGVGSKPMDPAGLDYLSAAEVVQQAVDEYGYESDEARARVSVLLSADFIFRGDETAYLFVLFNLLKNALYYVAAYPRTRVTIEVADQQVRVHDTGPGIAPDVLRDLFEPFRSVGKYGGTGLGLAYCQRVVRGFGGEIACRSVLGEFTEFTMRFPAVTPEEQEAHRREATAQARAALAGRRVLIVEDDALQRTATRQKLGPLALTSELDEAPDGQTALRLLERHKYDIVLLDLHMEGVDGYAVARQIRDGGGMNQDVRIVAYTSDPACVARRRALRAGTDGFVSKPCAQLPLLRALQHALQQPAPNGPQGAAGRLAGRRILVADDSAFNRKAVAAHLRRAAAIVIEVEHGAAVLEQLQAQHRIDAVLLDLQMPGMDGMETARAVRCAAAGWAGIPLLAMTARSDEAAMDAAAAAGMNGFLVKPFEAQELYETLACLLCGNDPAATVLPDSPPAPCQQGDILNLERLESYRRLDMLGELRDDYLPEMARLVGNLEQAVGRTDIAGSRDALHALLGMSGEAGARALYRQVRDVYVPLLEEGRWPAGWAWLRQLQATAERTEQELKAYCKAESRL
jgi:two-component system CAI-1 autoinducer sensor kinase/phosphatase CqsS